MKFSLIAVTMGNRLALLHCLHDRLKRCFASILRKLSSIRRWQRGACTDTCSRPSRIAYLIDKPTSGGGGEYVRKLQQGLSGSCESQVFYASKGECRAAIVKEWKPDVIHVNHLRALVQLFRSPWQRVKSPVIFTVHGIHLRKYDFLPHTLKIRILRFMRLHLERYLYRKCAALIALTNSDRDEIHRLYGRGLNVVVIPNGISADESSPSSPTKSLAPPPSLTPIKSLVPTPILANFFFICIGRFDFQKGQDILLRAIAQSASTLRAQNRRTLFIGGPSKIPINHHQRSDLPSQIIGIPKNRHQRSDLYSRFIGILTPPILPRKNDTLAEMKALATKLGILDLVEFAGEIPNAARFLSHGTILIAPSRWEGLPFLLLEAGLQQMPVIVSDCPGNRDIITPNMTGLLFPNEDINTLANLLTKDFSPTTLTQLGSALKSRVLSDFSLAQMLSATHALYSQFQ